MAFRAQVLMVMKSVTELAVNHRDSLPWIDELTA
jgi:hypothetical protein